MVAFAFLYALFLRHLSFHAANFRMRSRRLPSRAPPRQFLAGQLARRPPTVPVRSPLMPSFMHSAQPIATSRTPYMNISPMIADLHYDDIARAIFIYCCESCQYAFSYFCSFLLNICRYYFSLAAAFAGWHYGFSFCSCF